jgi:hypothetical protein
MMNKKSQGSAPLEVRWRIVTPGQQKCQHPQLVMKWIFTART